MLRRLLALLAAVVLPGALCLPLSTRAPAVGPPVGFIPDGLVAPLPPGAVVRLGVPRLRHTGAVEQIVFSRDGKRLFATASNGPLRLWDTATGMEQALPGLPTVRATALALAPDGRSLALATVANEVVLYDINAARIVSRWPTGGSPSQSLAFSDDGRSLAWLKAADPVRPVRASSWRKVLVRDLARGTDRALAGEIDRVDQLAFAPDGKALATSSNTYMQTWDLATGKRQRQYGERDNLMRVAFSRDGKALLTASNDHIVIWERDALEEALRLPSGERNGIRDLAVAFDGKRFAVTSRAHARVYLYPSGKESRSIDAKGDTLTALAFSRDTKVLATGDASGQLRLWDLATGKEKLPIPPRRPFAAVALSGDGRELIAVDSLSFSRWSVATGKRLLLAPLPSALLPEAALLRQACISPDGQLAAVWTRDHKLHLLDARRGIVLHSPKITASEELSLAFTPDSRHLVVALDRGGPRLAFLEARTGKQTRELGLPRGDWVPGLDFSRDGRSLLRLGGENNAAQLVRFEVSTGKPRRDMALPPDVWPRGMRVDNVRRAILNPGTPGRTSYPDGVPGQFVLSPDGRLAALPYHSRLYLIDTARGRIVARCEEGTEALRAAAFSPDGRLVAAAGDEGPVWLWDAQTGALRGRLDGHRDRVSVLRFSGDGKYLVSASDDVSAVVWDVRRALRQPPSRPPADLPALWAALASDDPRVVDEAIDRLRAAPAVSVPFLARQLRPVPAVAAGVVGRWVAELDSDKSALRAQARQQLLVIGEQAVAALEKASESGSAEVRRQARQLLAQLSPASLNGEQARPLRAVEALETVPTPAARALLAELARGAPEARLTREAAASLRRRQPGAEP